MCWHSTVLWKSCQSSATIPNTCVLYINWGMRGSVNHDGTHDPLLGIKPNHQTAMGKLLTQKN
jgi:hypothetical protein